MGAPASYKIIGLVGVLSGANAPSVGVVGWRIKMRPTAVCLRARDVSARVAAAAWEGTVADERGDYAVLISLATREEADVAASALRAQGVDAFLGNDHHAAAMPLGVQALGGMQIMVPAAQLAEAKTLLRARLKEWAEDDEDDDKTEPKGRRDRWKAWLILAIMVGPLLALIVFGIGGRMIINISRLLGH